MARVTLVNPPIEMAPERFGRDADPKMPMGLLYLAAALEQAGNEVDFVDAAAQGLGVVDIARQVRTFEPDYVGMTCLTITRPVVFELAKLIKGFVNSEIRIVLGGVHATLAPESCLEIPDIDFVITGEGEMVLPRLCHGTLSAAETPGVFYREGNVIRSTGPSRRIQNLDALPHPAYHQLPLMDAYLKARKELCLVASRGCPYACAFCCAPRLWKRRVIFRSPQNVVDEIASYRDRWKTIDTFHFLDDCFTEWGNGLDTFCKLITPMSVNWRCIGRIDHLNEEAVHEMAASGCVSISFGAETGSKRVQSACGKRLPLDVLLSKVRALSSAGIRTKAFFMFGFPGETEDDMLETVRYSVKLREQGLKDAVFMPLIPYFGTSVYEQVNAVNRRVLGESTSFPDWIDKSPQIAAKLAKYRTFPVTSANPPFFGGLLRVLAHKAYEVFYSDEHSDVWEMEFRRLLREPAVMMG